MEGARIPQVGEVVAGKYRLKRLLGEGGMGSVLEAEHLKLRQPIAIKFLNPSMLGVDEIVQRFEREARAAATLRSRHVVRVTDVEVTPEGVPYMVMELLDGTDLEAERERRKKLPYAEAVDYVLQACGALAEAHDAGIVHRDLKPGNLFLAREDAGRSVVKVLDFGISKFLHGDDVKLTSAGAIMGTALYMSPEQIRGDGSIDARADIWSLGVILFELISGEAPWMGATTRVAAGIVSESVPDLCATTPVPEALANAIYRMLEKSPANRLSTIAEVAGAIAPFAPPGSIGAEVADHLARRSQRNVARDVVSSSPSQPALTAPMMAPPHTPVSNAVLIAARSNNNPERSTMTATTTSANMLPRSPRALWGVLAGLCTLAMVGVALIVFVTRAKPATDEGPATAAASDSAAVSTATVAATMTAEPSPTPDVTAPPPASVAPSGTAARPPVATIGAGAKKPPPSGLAVREFPTTPTTSRPPPKASEAPPPVNPLFLK